MQRLGPLFLLLLLALPALGQDRVSSRPMRVTDGTNSTTVSPTSIKLPCLSTAARNALTPEAGTVLCHDDGSTSSFEVYTGSAWLPIVADTDDQDATEVTYSGDAGDPQGGIPALASGTAETAIETLQDEFGVVFDSTSAQRADINAIDAATIGLDNVDNTSDADKPVSTATQTALDQKQDAATLKADVEQSVEVYKLQDYDERVADKTQFVKFEAGVAQEREVVSGVTTYEWNPENHPILYIVLPGSNFTLNFDDTWQASGFNAELEVRVYFVQPAAGGIEVLGEWTSATFDPDWSTGVAGDDDEPDPTANAITRFGGTFASTTLYVLERFAFVP